MAGGARAAAAVAGGGREWFEPDGRPNMTLRERNSALGDLLKTTFNGEDISSIRREPGGWRISF